MIGPVPKGLFVMHTCDIPRCCNPAHLRLGTCADNNADMREKKRHRFGDRHPMRTNPECRATGERSGMRKHPELVRRGEDAAGAKLEAADIAVIRSRYAAGEMQKVLAAQFNISSAHVSGIVNRKFWKHLP